LLAGPGGRPVLLAETPSDISFAVPPGSLHVSLEYGIVDSAWQQGHTDGVEFRALADTGDGRTLLWSRRLDPAGTPADRGLQSAAVTLPPTSRALVLQTLPGAKPSWYGSYWASPDFR
jgi:hypothetical protein